MKIGLIGAGKLGKALIDGFRQKNIELMASDAHKEECNGAMVLADNKKVACENNIIFLAVKPKNMDSVLKEVSEEVKGKLVISVAAGLPLQFFESRINSRIVRAMPNIAVKKCKAVLAFKLGKNCSTEDKKIVEKVLGCLGKPVEVENENALDVVTGISGSGIAYFVKIMNCFIETAKKQGMPEAQAKEIVLETVKGAIDLMEGTDAKQLLQDIASKGGTTEEGLKELKEKKLEESLESTINKTIEKCKKLGERQN